MSIFSTLNCLSVHPGRPYLLGFADASWVLSTCLVSDDFSTQGPSEKGVARSKLWCSQRTYTKSSCKLIENQANFCSFILYRGTCLTITFTFWIGLCSLQTTVRFWKFPQHWSLVQDTSKIGADAAAWSSVWWYIRWRARLGEASNFLMKQADSYWPRTWIWFLF